MAEFYSEYGERPVEKQRRSLLILLLDGVMTLLTFVSGIAMALVLLVPHVNPVYLWALPVLGLAAPAIYVVTVMLTLYWVIRWRWMRAGVLLLLVIAGLFDVSLFYKPELRRIYNEPTYERSAFKVMTFNVRSFYNEKGRSSANDILHLIADHAPDIVCLQEYNGRLAEHAGMSSLLEESYEPVAVGSVQNYDSMRNSRLMIYSRFRVLRSGTILSSRESVWVDVLIDEDTVRIFNNHLRSTAIKASDDEFITNHRYLSDTAREDRIRSIVSRLRDNSIKRAAQVDNIAQVIEATSCRRIVCGDFNDTPMSYVYRTMAGDMNDAFRECGKGYSHTFRGFFNTLRIDYVLSSDGFETLSYEVLPVEFSDHYPVLVRLKKTPKNN